MTILENLNFSEKSRAAMLISPEVKLRGKMLGALDLQIEAATRAQLESLLRSETPKIVLQQPQP